MHQLGSRLGCLETLESMAAGEAFFSVIDHVLPKQGYSGFQGSPISPFPHFSHVQSIGGSTEGGRNLNRLFGASMMSRSIHTEPR